MWEVFWETLGGFRRPLLLLGPFQTSRIVYPNWDKSLYTNDLLRFIWICSRSWNRAAQRCRDGLLRNSNLASVTSDAIHQYVLEGMKRRNLDFVWLGGTDKIKEGTWSWIDGSPFEFTNWSRREPNNWKIEPNEPDEDCMHMDRLGRLGQDRGKWNDLRCDTKLHFLCAKKICQTG